MPIITWNQPYYYCHRPIIRGRPTLLFSRDEPTIADLSHSTCCFSKMEFSHFQMCPPDHLSSGQFSFLVHFLPALYKLPGGFEPDRALRRCLVSLLYDAPDSLDNPMKYLRKYQTQNYNKEDLKSYHGDLEADFLRFLGRVQRMVKEQPSEVEVNFRKVRSLPK